MQDLAAGNPEFAALLSDPEAVQAKMAEAMGALGSGGDGDFQTKMAAEMESILSDPEKFKIGLEQFATNPMFKGVVAGQIPVQEVLANPALMRDSLAHMQEAVGGDMSKLGEVLGDMMGGKDAYRELLSNPKALEQGMAQAQKMFGPLLGGLGGDDDAVMAKMREQLASLRGAQQ